MLRPKLDPHPLICIAAAIEADASGRERLNRVFASGVELDSRLVLPGDLFVALPGRTVHGAAHADQAIERGAVAILTDPTGQAQLRDRSVPIFVTQDLRKRLGVVAAQVYRTSEGASARQAMQVLAVTGTNGKTTVAHLVEAGLRASGLVTGLIGTIGITIGQEHWATPRTTPESVHLHAALAAMAQRGVQAVALEASSHALAEGRLDGLIMDVAGFTNLSQDHLDYHGDMESYFLAKAQLFTPHHARLGVIGIDDPYGRRLASLAAIDVQTWSAGDDQRPCLSEADWRLQPAGAADQWIAVGPGVGPQELQPPLPGAFNRANALCAYAMLCRAGIPAEVAAAGLSAVVVPGRMESVRVAPEQQVLALVDYAHTPEAIDRVLRTLQAQRGELPRKLIAVIGAGGNRDREKRPAMGAAAAELADVVIVTDDNPRDEDPASIRAAVLSGTRSPNSQARVMEVADRSAAIRAAVQQALPDGIVAVLGKGHETTQEVAGLMEPFDDRLHLAQALRDVSGWGTGEVSLSERGSHD